MTNVWKIKEYVFDWVKYLQAPDEFLSSKSWLMWVKDSQDLQTFAKWLMHVETVLVGT